MATKKDTTENQSVSYTKNIKVNETNPINDILSHTPHFAWKQTKKSKSTTSRYQQPFASVRAGKGQPRYDCGRQVLQ